MISRSPLGRARSGPGHAIASAPVARAATMSPHLRKLQAKAARAKSAENMVRIIKAVGMEPATDPAAGHPKAQASMRRLLARNGMTPAAGR